MDTDELLIKMTSAPLKGFNGLNSIPMASGVYTAWLHGESRCFYVGRATKLKDRIKKHFSGARGGDHKGLDSKKNMLVLCPNHHALFDYGVIAVDTDDMKIKHINPNAEENRLELEFSHRVDIENLKYHFKNIFKGYK